MTPLRHLFILGFNEFQEESDIAFYTGILGVPSQASSLGDALTPFVQWLHSFSPNSSPLYFGCVQTVFDVLPCGLLRRRVGYCGG